MNYCMVGTAIQREAVELHKELFIFNIEYLFKLMFATENEKNL